MILWSVLIVKLIFFNFFFFKHLSFVHANVLLEVLGIKSRERELAGFLENCVVVFILTGFLIVLVLALLFGGR